MKFLLYRKWNFRKILDLLDTTCDDKDLQEAVIKKWKFAVNQKIMQSQ